MLKIGLTGGIGSGKTAVSEQFKKLGIKIIDTDIISRELVNHNQMIKNKIVAFFGDSILGANNTIDRKKLANIIFANKQKKRQLEDILHPAIRSNVKQKIQTFELQSSPPEYLIVVIPLLLETGFSELIDRILVVIAEEKPRVERIKQRDNRPLDEIRAIIDSQAKDNKRLSAADDIIENNNNIEHLAAHVKRLDKKYRQLGR